jgi:hypothetical protein
VFAIILPPKCDFFPQPGRFIFMMQTQYVFYEVLNEFLYLIRRSYHLEEPGVDERIILRWILRKWDVEYGLDRTGQGQGQVAGTCECGDERSGSIKCGEFLDLLKTG